MAGKVITAESKVNVMKEKQSQNVCYKNVTGKEQKSKDEEVDLKKLMLYSYLLNPNLRNPKIIMEHKRVHFASICC